MVQRYSPQDRSGACRVHCELQLPTSLGVYSEIRITGGCFYSSYSGRYSDYQWHPYPSAGFRLPWPSWVGREVGSVMLSVSGLYNFYFIRNFCDMRSKYDRVLSIIRQQFNREPSAGDIFIMMSKDQRKVRLFNPNLDDFAGKGIAQTSFRRGRRQNWTLTMYDWYITV